VAFARRHGILLCHDAPYCDLAYDGYSPPSILQVPGAAETAVEFNSLSKTFSMAGWRAGMAVGNSRALALLAQVKSNIDSGMFLPLQKAATVALATPPTWIAQRNQIYKQRLDVVLSGLERLGLEIPVVRASPYVWIRVPDSLTSETFARRLLEKTGVALAPGSFFGPGGEGYVRISLTAPTERVQTAIGRLASWPAWAGAS
jgi:LL-diaminopimelate aminotransferase